MRESNPLFRAVLSNDLKELTALVEAGNSVNIQNAKGSSLLNFVMRRKSVEIFDYLLSLEEIDVNCLDQLDQSPLVYLAGVCFDEYFALQLIKKGADIHYIDNDGFNFLHLAAKSENDDNVHVGQLIIEKGADINQQAQFGVTPLYAACEVGNFDWVCMLLYYGADVTISTDRGVLPLVVVPQDIPEEQQLQLQEILFNYTFDTDKVSIRLPTVVAAMTLNSPLFSKICEYISDITYDMLDIQYFVDSLIHVKPKHLKLFVEKFGCIVKEMIVNFPVMDVVIRITLYCELQGLKEILDIFLNSDYICEFVQSSNPRNSTVALLLEALSVQHQLIDQEEITKVICLMLSYGLNVTSSDLNAVYQHFGFCDLFKILLHMDIPMRSSNNVERSMAVMFYDPLFNVEDLFDDHLVCTALLDYYNDPRLKYLILSNSSEESVLEKAKNLPQVPLLVELSRNAARKFIVNRFKIKNSAQFYTILQWLPIGELNRRIVALEKKLY